MQIFTSCVIRDRLSKCHAAFLEKSGDKLWWNHDSGCASTEIKLHVHNSQCSFDFLPVLFLCFVLNIPVGFIYPHYLCQMPFLRVLLYFRWQHCFWLCMCCTLCVCETDDEDDVCNCDNILSLTNEKCSPRSVSVAVMLEFFALLRFGCNL